MINRIVKLLVSSLLYLCDSLGAVLMKSIGIPPRGTCVVLYYHGVPPRTRMAFGRQMERLARQTAPIPIDHAYKLERGRHYSAVTFDDGFANVFENALPVLKRIGIPAAVFIPSGHIGHFPAWIKDQGADARRYQLADRDLINQWKTYITIGSHTVSHPDLTQLSPGDITFELRESKTCLEKLAGKSVVLLSFPHGRYDDRVLQTAFIEGYDKVFTIEPDLILDHLNHRIIGRVEVSPSDWAIEFRLKLFGAYRWMKQASHIKGVILQVASSMQASKPLSHSTRKTVSGLRG